MSFVHYPVLADEVVSFCPEQAELYFDFTLGGGGHAALLLERFPHLNLQGSDQDPAALQAATSKLAPFGDRVTIHRSDMVSQAAAYREAGLKADYILADLGVSSAQLDQAERGFSFLQEGPLDMRMDTDAAMTAGEYLAVAKEEELVKVLFEYGEESFARKIAREIVTQRATKALQTTKELADLVYRTIPRKLHPKKKHPATKTFQALRVQINDELGQLRNFLEEAKHLLNLGGRLAMISFHSLEDRPVKQTFNSWENPCTCPPHIPVCQCGVEPIGVRVTRKPVSGSDREVKENPRARSAKLRIFERQ